METKSYTGKDFYESFLEYVKDNPMYQVEYRVFRDILNDYFKYLRDELIEEGREIKLPCRMGTLCVVKHKPKTFTSKSLRVDYAESKKLGKITFHLNSHTNFFKYRYYWNKQNMLTKNKTKYQLVMTRENKRRLAYILKNRLRDYQEI